MTKAIAGHPALLVLLLMTTLSWGEDHSATARELISAANAGSDLSTMRPYRLEAGLILFPGTKNEKKGSIVILRDKERSRTEMTIGNYHELGIVVGNQSHWFREFTSVPHKDFVSPELANIPDVRQLWRFVLASSDRVGEVVTSEIQGQSAKCFDVTIMQGRSERNCFDPSNGNWVESGTWYSDRQKTKLQGGTRFLDYASFGDKQFPRTIRKFGSGRVIAEIRDIAVKPAQFQDADFAIPPKAVLTETCDDLAPPRKIEDHMPDYPGLARASHTTGDVVLLALIGPTGHVDLLSVVSGHPILIQASIDAAKRWRYAPAMCPAGPVAVQTYLTIRFHM